MTSSRNDQATYNVMILIIIPIWSGFSRIAATLGALRKQTVMAEFETITGDIETSDITAAIGRAHPKVRLPNEPQPEAYRARRPGLPHAREQYALFTDTDCIATPDWRDLISKRWTRRGLSELSLTLTAACLAETVCLLMGGRPHRS